MGLSIAEIDAMYAPTSTMSNGDVVLWMSSWRDTIAPATAKAHE